MKDTWNCWGYGYRHRFVHHQHPVAIGQGVAVVGFLGNVARIATTHQRGLKDRVTRDRPRVEYAQRVRLIYRRERGMAR